MIRVYQLNREAFIAHMRNVWLPDAPSPNFPGDYVHVADVNGHTVEDAYRLTNHIDCYWWDNAGVTVICETPCRSTSVGDIVVLADGQVLRCENSGWSALPNLEAPKEN